MKLSEAIREGSFFVTPNVHRWLEVKGDVCRGCATGAALYAAGVREDVVNPREVVQLLEKYWPWTAEYALNAAIKGVFTLPARITIAFNQDGFEGAAKLVEELEKEFAPAETKEEVCEQQLSA